MQYKGYYAIQSFKVTNFGTNQKSICDFLFVINTNYILSRTISKLSQIIVPIWYKKQSLGIFEP